MFGYTPKRATPDPILKPAFLKAGNLGCLVITLVCWTHFLGSILGPGESHVRLDNRNSVGDTTLNECTCLEV